MTMMMKMKKMRVNLSPVLHQTLLMKVLSCSAGEVTM